MKLLPFSSSKQLGHVHKACQQTFALLPEHLFREYTKETAISRGLQHSSASVCILGAVMSLTLYF